jgi:ribosomal protein S18 acetylase RimI-like enzyme
VGDWTIRTGHPGDAEALVALWRAAGAVPGATDDPEALTALLEFDDRALLVAERDGALVGSLIAAWDGWRASFYRLAVAPPVRRRGLATALVREGEARLRALGARRLAVIVVGDEPHAMEFWTAIGYERQQRRTRFVTAL